MTYKMQQVLRTNKVLRSISNEVIPSGTRVVVMRMLDAGKARVKVADPALPTYKGKRVIAGTDAFIKTSRGRPKEASK